MTTSKSKSKLKLKIGLRPGTELSTSFVNDRNCYKVVEVDNVLGYVVSSGSRVGVATVLPLYRADVFVKAGKTWHVVSSYELGERLNGYTYHVDYEGCTFAMIAAQAVRALEERQAVRALSKPAKKQQRRKRTR